MINLEMQLRITSLYEVRSISGNQLMAVAAGVTVGLADIIHFVKLEPFPVTDDTKCGDEVLVTIKSKQKS